MTVKQTIVRHALVDLQLACKRGRNGEVDVGPFPLQLFNSAVLLYDPVNMLFA